MRESGQVRRMDDRGLIKRRGFWLVALLWLPVGVAATAALRFAPEAEHGMWLSMMLMSAGSLVPVAPCGQGGGDGSGHAVKHEPNLLRRILRGRRPGRKRGRVLRRGVCGMDDSPVGFRDAQGALG